MQRVKFQLRRVHLNSGGYDSSGSYWGVDAPLWYYASDDLHLPERSDHLRASSRDAAKAKVRAANADLDVRFYR